MSVRTLGCAALLLAVAACVHAPARPPTDPDRVASSEAACERFFRDQPLANLEVAVLRGGRLVYARGLGQARPDSPDAPTPHTPYRIASLTKLFTGLALEQLRARGTLSFDDPLERFLPEAAGLIYPTAERPPITLRQLVTHTSGLPRDLDEHLQPESAQWLNALSGLRLELTPGTDYLYSNLAMALAGMVIERASGEPYKRYVEAHLLGPLGLTETGFAPPATAADWCQSPPCPARRELEAFAPAGGLFSTAADLLAFAAFELSAWPPRDAPDPAGVLSRAALRETQLQRGPRNGINWFVGTREGAPWLDHAGALESQVSFLGLAPQAQLAVVLLGTVKGGAVELQPLALELARLWATGLEGHPLDNERQQLLARLLAAFAGAVDPLYQAFGPALRQAVPRERFAAELAQTQRDLGRCQLERVDEAVGIRATALTLVCQQGRLRVGFTVDAETHTLSGLTWSRLAAGSP